MTDLTKTIAPKSDQLNSDDLIGRSMTIRVTKVSLCSEPDQPIAIGFEGDSGKPYKPCKSMRRVLVNVWGGDGNAYAGRSMTIYRDDKVQFGGMAVGGIRISHMSDIKKDVTMALTATRANRKPFTVKPLVDAPSNPTPPTETKPTPMQWFTARIAGLENREQCAALFAEGTKARALLDQQSEEDSAAVYDMLSEKRASFLAGPTPPPDDSDFPGDLPSGPSA